MLYHYMRFRLRFSSLLPFLSYDFVLYERSSLPFCLKVQRMMILRFSIDLFCGVCLPLPKYFSIPETTSHRFQSDGIFKESHVNADSTPWTSGQQVLLKLGAVVGILYPAAFFLSLGPNLVILFQRRV